MVRQDGSWLLSVKIVHRSIGYEGMLAGNISYTRAPAKLSLRIFVHNWFRRQDSACVKIHSYDLPSDENSRAWLGELR